MGKLYVVRHGECIWNAENKICGITDIALTPKGHEQAIHTGQLILESGIWLDEIISSPLIRALETARHIREITGKPMRIDKRLMELNFGKYESMPCDGEEFIQAKQHFADRYENGESMLHMAQRIYNIVDEIKDDPEKKTYLLVAHNGVARIIESYFRPMTNKEFASFVVKNCAILTYEW